VRANKTAIIPRRPDLHVWPMFTKCREHRLQVADARLRRGGLWQQGGGAQRAVVPCGAGTIVIAHPGERGDRRKHRRPAWLRTAAGSAASTASVQSSQAPPTRTPARPLETRLRGTPDRHGGHHQSLPSACPESPEAAAPAPAQRGGRRERGAAGEQLAAGQAGDVTLRGDGGRLAQTRCKWCPRHPRPSLVAPLGQRSSFWIVHTKSHNDRHSCTRNKIDTRR